MESCPVHRDGHVCKIEGPHATHAVRIYEDANDREGRTISWSDPVPEVPPNGRANGGFSNRELADMANRLETPIERMSRAGGPQGSKNGAKVGKYTARTHKWYVLLVYSDIDHPMIDEEGGEICQRVKNEMQGFDDPRSKYWWKRIGELIDAGFLETVGMRMSPTTEVLVRDVQITPEGRAVFLASRKG